jgi:ABC-2 type transport system ATP-binding protein
MPEGGDAAAGAPDERLQIVAARRAIAGRELLGGVSLVLERGQIRALLGPNGAGKTSLIRAICGRLRLDAGEVRLGALDPRRDAAARRRLGLVPQEIALYPDLSARQNLEVLGRLAGLARGAARAAAESGLRWVGLSERAESPARRLSGGMRRRLNLAAGVLHAPAFVLLDEPSLGVDPEAREGIHDLLRQLRARGTGILLATHDLDQAEELADRVALLVEGRVRAEGTQEELVEAAFGRARELIVTLVRAPDPAARALLEGEGLRPTAVEETWTGPLEDGLEGLARCGARLRDAGLETTELRVRAAGLRGVFFRLVGREASP